MKVIVDTNVAVVANKAAPQASVQCIAYCVQWLRQIQTSHTLVLDDEWQILKEYMDNLRRDGQPGVGDAFLKWALTNRENPNRCVCVHINRQGDSFVEFPSDPALTGFDPSDRKFVATALAHPEHPCILNATDSDWWHYRDILLGYEVRVEFVCPDLEFKNS